MGTMIHRHMSVRLDIPTEELPSAAIVDILERGDLNDWRPIAAVIVRDPNGEFAERVMQLIDAHPLYGTSPLWRSWIDRCRIREEGRRQQRPSAGLAMLRGELGLTQTELARRRGISQSDLSKLERREDVRLSTLRAHAKALGGRLRVLFVSDGREVEIRMPKPKS